MITGRAHTRAVEACIEHKSWEKMIFDDEDEYDYFEL